MKLKICVIGKPKLSYAKAGVDEYFKRLERYTKIELVHLKEGSKEQEGERLLEASQNCIRVVMDERGVQVGSVAFTEKLQSWEMRGEKACAFLIGGSDGHTQSVRDKADLVFSLSKMALQHELALVVLLEQLYRAETIKKGEPYHRE